MSHRQMTHSCLNCFFILYIFKLILIILFISFSRLKRFFSLILLSTLFTVRVSDDKNFNSEKMKHYATNIVLIIDDDSSY